MADCRRGAMNRARLSPSGTLPGHVGVPTLSATVSDAVDKEEALRKFSLVIGPDGEKMLAELEEVAPELGRYIVEFGYGEVYARPGLQLRERQLVTLAALVAQGGAAAQLELHIGGALRVGIARAEVIEAIVQCLPFVGFPRVLNAVATARQVFETEAG